MAHTMSITFLGTSSGGGPTENRNCPSLVCDFFEGNNLWMVDCAEGTTRQFALQPNRPGVPRVKINQVTKLFVTHMHADHIMGIPTLLRNVLRAPRIDAPPPPSNAIAHRKAVCTPVHVTITLSEEVCLKPIIHIFGPCGLRSFIRQNLKLTFTRCDDTYVVHELLKSDDSITPCNPPPDEHDPASGSSYKDWNILHCNELPGRDILADEQGLWRNITSQIYARRSTTVSIHAGPILHRDPCIGYVFDETTQPRRKVVVLGDTYDPSPIIPLCSDPNPSLLVHEATDSTISRENDHVGKLSKRSIEDVMKTTLARGHSTPMMAGEFAKRTKTQKLVLNHIGSRFPAPRIGDNRGGFTSRLLEDMEDKATKTWDPPSGAEAIVALDFMRVLVPEPNTGKDISSSITVSSSASASVSTMSLANPLPAKPPLPIPPVNVNSYPPSHHVQNPAPALLSGPLSGQLGGLPSPMPIRATGQPGYYGQPRGYDPVQMAQSYYTFAQMMHLAATAGTNIVEGIGMGTGMPILIPTLMQMQMPATGMGMHPYGIPVVGGGTPTPTPVDAAMTRLVALAGALETQPPGQHRVDVTGDLEGLECDPVIARSIAAANVRYENAPSNEPGDMNKNRMFDGDHGQS
ncbi:Zinc phosphodiesterase ELAC protein 1 [Leucoagaricus sp. SymC.cos]|nr:Zinc phosphodiesterase ELAC protein 1 [Leucoagaricus sp. SymC.cos]